jgi:thiamine-phosphate pyrophosphorylase
VGRYTARAVPSPIDPVAVRQRLAEARLLLVLTPALVPEHEVLPRLLAAAPWLGLVQVRPKALGKAGVGGDVTEARAARDWTLATLDALHAHGFGELPVVVNDRVDVARALQERGVAGVHLGEDDMPPGLARELLGPDALIGLSTHDEAAVLAAAEAPVDLLGFGPVFATTTKGYGVGAGAERAWIAASASPWPLFPIGGIDPTNIDELADVGRAAVGSAILAATDPAAAARHLYEALSG